MQKMIWTLLLIGVATLSGCSSQDKEKPVVNRNIPSPSKTTSSKNDDPVIEKKLTIQLVNQYGEALHGGPEVTSTESFIALYDSVGEKVPGMFEFFKLFKFNKDIPKGVYTIQWKDSWFFGPKIGGDGPGETGFYSVRRKIQGGEKTIEVPNNDGNWFVTIPVEQTGISYFNGGGDVSMKLQNEAGTPIKFDYGKGKAEVLNEKGNVVGAVISNGSDGNFKVLSARAEYMIPGVYTIEIKKDGYKVKTVKYTLPDVSDWTDDMIVTKKPGIIDLGTVTLERE